MITDIIIKIDKQTDEPISEDILKQKALLILHQTSLSGIVEIDLTICDESFIQKLNQKFRNIDKPTDVLSFPLTQLYRGKPKKSFFPIAPDEPLHLGDIILCHPYIAKQAKELNHSFKEEFYHLFEHGVKHLVGFHHKEN